MRHLMALLAVAASVLGTAPAYADLCDQLAELLPNDGFTADEFGRSVAISGTTAIVGAWLDDDNGPDSGSAYLFDITTGRQIAKLLPNDGAAGDYFGFSVAISDTTAIVGAHRDDDNGTDSGSAYVFLMPPGGWVDMTDTTKLLPNDGVVLDRFGFSVAISGATAILGAPQDDDNDFNSGSAYLFDTTTGRQMAKLLANDGAVVDEFGYSVSISGDVIVVGTQRGDGICPDCGSAYVFLKPPGGWVDMTDTTKLLANDGAAGDGFGWFVAISGATAIVGAFGDDDNGSGSGSAYLFDITTGRQIAKLLANDGAAEDQFGWSVGITGAPGKEVAIVGSIGDDDNGIWSGSAYLFDITTGRQIAKLMPDDGAANHVFGVSVAISGATAIVGAYHDDDNGGGSGSAYLFDAAGAPACPADITGPGGVPDGCVDAFDLGAMLGAWCSAVSDPNPPSPPCENCTPANLRLADISGAANAPDGCVDAFDLGKLLAAWCSVAGGNPCGTCQ